MYKSILIFTMILGFFHSQADSFQENEAFEGIQHLFDVQKEDLESNAQEEAQRAFDRQMQEGIKLFFRHLDSIHFIELLNDEISSNPYLKDNGYEVLTENSQFSDPESTYVISSGLISLALLTAGPLPTLSVPALISVLGVLFSDNIDGIYPFFRRLEFDFTVLDRDQQQHPGSCLFYTAYDHLAEGLHYEYDACYLRLITGWENAQVVPIPQTVDGHIRVGESMPFIGKFDDWMMGQTKVVGTGFIPISLD